MLLLIDQEVWRPAVALSPRFISYQNQSSNKRAKTTGEMVTLRTRLLPWGRFGVDCKEKVGVILSPRKRGGGEGKLYFLLRVKGHLQRMMWQQQMVLEVCKCIYDALKRALRCASCTLKLKWWPNLKGRILVHPSIMNLLDEFSKNLNNYGDK